MECDFMNKNLTHKMHVLRKCRFVFEKNEERKKIVFEKTKRKETMFSKIIKKCANKQTYFPKTQNGFNLERTKNMKQHRILKMECDFSCDGTNNVLDFDVRSGLVTSNVSPKVSRHDDRN